MLEEEIREVQDWVNKEVVEKNYRDITDLIGDAYRKGEMSKEELEDYKSLACTSPYYRDLLRNAGVDV